MNEEISSPQPVPESFRAPHGHNNGLLVTPTTRPGTGRLSKRYGVNRANGVKSLLLGLGAGAVTLLLVLSLWTLFNVDTVVGDVANSQSNHAQTLYQIDNLTKQVKAEISKLDASTATVNQILKEAGTLSTRLLAQQTAICAALPACHLP